MQDPDMTGREELKAWEETIRENSYLNDPDFRHLVAYHFPSSFEELDQKLADFASIIVDQVEPLVAENSRPENLPRISSYDAIGNEKERIIHHPSYIQAGNAIYSSGMMKTMAQKGKLTEGLLSFFLSSQAGEAGHNCPIACSYGLIRLLNKFADIPNRDFYLEKLTAPSFEDNFTAAQFVTEVQGGSDAGTNCASAIQDEQGNWRITGEKWFCSNANANLFLMTARFDPNIKGTKGLGLFLVPAPNHFTFNRLKDKLGTKTLATAEMQFNGASAIPIGKPEEGFKILMENVLHASRLFNAITVLGMARRAFQIAFAYAQHRTAFGHPLLHYPLVQETLALVKAENTALLASIFATTKLQDACDLQETEEQKLLLRLLANLNKTLTAEKTVNHIHNCLDILAGNGTIETFSPIPLLLRDSIICENWEGTHNVLYMQILRDIQRYQIDELFIRYLEPLVGADPKLIELRSLLNQLKNSPTDIQTLLIKEVVHAMGELFALTHLSLEAADQKEKGSFSKAHCLKLLLNKQAPLQERILLYSHCL